MGQPKTATSLVTDAEEAAEIVAQSVAKTRELEQRVATLEADLLRLMIAFEQHLTGEIGEEDSDPGQS